MKIEQGVLNEASKTSQQNKNEKEVKSIRKKVIELESDKRDKTYV